MPQSSSSSIPEGLRNIMLLYPLSYVVFAIIYDAFVLLLQQVACFGSAGTLKHLTKLARNLGCVVTASVC